MEGGKKKKRLHYRGDIKPERLWTVNREGNNLVTIETEDRDYLKPEDCIKVVTPDKVYSSDDYYEQYNNNAIHQQIPPQPHPQQTYENVDPRFVGEDPRNIIIAPVIKVFSGEGSKDMSQTRGDEGINNYNEAADGATHADQPPPPPPEIPELDFSKPLIIEKS